MEKQRINKRNEDENARNENTNEFPVRIRILDRAKTRPIKISYSRNELAENEHRCIRRTN